MLMTHPVQCNLNLLTSLSHVFNCTPRKLRIITVGTCTPVRAPLSCSKCHCDEFLMMWRTRRDLVETESCTGVSDCINIHLKHWKILLTLGCNLECLLDPTLFYPLQGWSISWYLGCINCGCASLRPTILIITVLLTKVSIPNLQFRAFQSTFADSVQETIICYSERPGRSSLSIYPDPSVS